LKIKNKNKKSINEEKNIYIEKKISKFKCNKVSVLILVFVRQPPVMEIVPQKFLWSASFQAVWARVSGGGPCAFLVFPFNMKWRCSAQAGRVEGSKF
jgi:4-diphosphocytidyl-2C-methyl-D-erythritol kinase